MKFGTVACLAIGLCLIAANGSMADTGIVERFKKEDFGWEMLSVVRDLVEKQVDNYDHCELATSYKWVVDELEAEIESREIFLRETVTLTPEEAEEMSRFLEQVKLDFRDADRRCRH